MNSSPTYLQHAILFIDDELQSQKYFSQIFSNTFKVYLASDGEQGLQLFRDHQKEIGVVVSDQRMPGMSGSELLGEIAKESPNVVKILSTAYSDLDAAIDAVNEGGIYRYVTKPWDLAELEVTLRRAMDFHLLKEQHRALAHMKIAGLEQMFHQSRLLACLAIPALLDKQPSAIRALRDILRLSLNPDESSSKPLFSDVSSLTKKDRLELVEKAQSQLQSLLGLSENRTSPDPAELENLTRLISGPHSGENPPPLVSALFKILQGECSPQQLDDLASLLNAYKSGYEIQRHGSGWHFAQSSPDTQALSIFNELYSLFVDDAFLVNVILGEMP